MNHSSPDRSIVTINLPATTLPVAFKAVGVMAVIVGAVLAWRWWQTNPLVSPPPPPISQIQAMSDLATTSVHIVDSIELENNHYLGRWELHGDVILGVDLSAVDYLEVDQHERRLRLRLSQPHIISTKVDHERSQELFLKPKVFFASLRSSSQLLRDEVWKQADRKIARLGEHLGYRERAKVHAERVLEDFFESLDWKVDFEWCEIQESEVTGIHDSLAAR